VDKYGRQLSAVQETESLRRFYRVDPVESSAGPDYARGEVLLESSDEEDRNSEGAMPSDDENEDIVVLGRDTDRPLPVSEEEDAEVNLDEDDTVDSVPEVAPHSKIAPEDEQEGSRRTRRIAVVDLDWDYVRAAHLYKIFSSAVSPVKSFSKSDAVFTPAMQGKVLSVRIYPSKFGLERMAHEEKGPPPELFKKNIKTDYEEDVNERTIYETGNSGEYDEDALRKYQLERLRYYYAIVECDTVNFATHLYSELQGAELERSANVLSLSFVPDDMTFDEECRDQATSAGESTNHQPLDFTTDALRHSKVKLTWDQDDAERDRVTRRTLSLKDIEENDFRAYIASSSDEAHESEVKSMKKSIGRDKLRAMLLEGGGHNLPEGWAGSKPNDLGDEAVTWTWRSHFVPLCQAERMKTKQRLGGTSAKCERSGRNAERICRKESKTSRLRMTFLLKARERKTVMGSHVRRSREQRSGKKVNPRAFPPRRSFHYSSLRIDSIQNQSISTWRQSSKQKRARRRSTREEGRKMSAMKMRSKMTSSSMSRMSASQRCTRITPLQSTLATLTSKRPCQCRRYLKNDRSEKLLVTRPAWPSELPKANLSKLYRVWWKV